MLSSLYSGISGLLSKPGRPRRNKQQHIEREYGRLQIAHSPEFEDVLYQTITGASGTSQVGRGSGLESVTTDFSQGSFETTNSSTDLAIGGQGFFIVKKATDQTPYYTRVGSFSLIRTAT